MQSTTAAFPSNASSGMASSQTSMRPAKPLAVWTAASWAGWAQICSATFGVAIVTAKPCSSSRRAATQPSPPLLPEPQTTRMRLSGSHCAATSSARAAPAWSMSTDKGVPAASMLFSSSMTFATSRVGDCSVAGEESLMAAPFVCGHGCMDAGAPAIARRAPGFLVLSESVFLRMAPVTSFLQRACGVQAVCTAQRSRSKTR